MSDTTSDQYSETGTAKHYNSNRVGTMYIFEQTYGTKACMLFCEMNALKYRLRIGLKASQPADREITKIGWYERAAKYYEAKMNSQDEIVVDNTKSLISYTE